MRFDLWQKSNSTQPNGLHTRLYRPLARPLSLSMRPGAFSIDRMAFLAAVTPG